MIKKVKNGKISLQKNRSYITKYVALTRVQSHQRARARRAADVDNEVIGLWLKQQNMQYAGGSKKEISAEIERPWYNYKKTVIWDNNALTVNMNNKKYLVNIIQ